MRRRARNPRRTTRDVRSPENDPLKQLCAFRGCGRICHWLLAHGIPSTAPKTSFWSNSLLFGAVVGSVIGCLQFRPQSRKRAFATIVCFSRLWWDLSLAACGIPSTAPKTSFWSNCVLFGAVVGSVIGCLWNSGHSPENELLDQFFAFRGCGGICHWLLVEFRPRPRKRAFGAIVCFSRLWWDLSLAACGIPSTAPKTSFWSNCVLFGAVVGSVIGCLHVEFRPQPRKRAFGPILCFSGLWWDLSLAACGIPSTAPKTSFWSNCVLFGAVVGSVIPPQPRKRAFGAIVCLSGLWQDLSLAACGIPSTAPKTSFWNNCVLFEAVVGSVIGCLWNSVHSPENELLEQLSAFRGCGRICHWLLVEFRPQPRKRAFGAILCLSGLWQDLTSTCPIDWLLLEFRPQP